MLIVGKTSEKVVYISEFTNNGAYALELPQAIAECVIYFVSNLIRVRSF